MMREELAELLLGAGTVEDCERAERALERWMQDHPEDHSMRETARGLSLFRLDSPNEPSAPRRPTVQDAPESEQAYYLSCEYAESFERDVRTAMERLGCDYSAARDLVMSYRPAPVP